MSKQHQMVRMLSQLRMGSMLAHGPESLPGTNSMRSLCAASGRSVAAAAGVRSFFDRGDMDRACRLPDWRGRASFSTGEPSSSATTQTITMDQQAGAAANAFSSPVSQGNAASMTDATSKTWSGSGQALIGSLRHPVYAFGGDSGPPPGGKEGDESTASPASTVDLPADIFAQPLRTDILHRVVRWQLARRQQGTHKTKTRSEVRGGGRKPWQQKGSGRARQGTIRAVQWRGGGVVHGPVVRSHAHDLPKKVRRLGLAVAVSAKAEEGRLVIVDKFAGDGDTESLSSAKTQPMLQRIDGLLERAEVPVTRRSVLMVDGAGGVPTSVVKSTRNIPWVDVMPVVGLNVYSILQRDVLVMTREAVEGLITRLHTPIKR